MSLEFTVATQAQKVGDLDMVNDDIRLRAVTEATWTPDPANATMAAIPKYAGTTDRQITVGKAVTDGVFTFTDIDSAFVAVDADGSSNPINGFVVYRFVTNEDSSMPCVYLELAAPYAPSGSDINVKTDVSGVWK